MLCSLLAAPLPASASAPDSELLNRINAYREAPHTCNGERLPEAGPLEANAALARVKLTAGTSLQDALKSVGYRAARAQAMSVSDMVDPEQVMNVLQRKYCRELMNRKVSAAGVSHDGRQWTIVLAHPLLSPTLGDWQEAGRQVLQRVNDARQQARDCGTRHFSAAQALTWNQELASAAHVHSQDMANRNDFSHRAPDGSDVGDRARRAGYAWHEIGENIAAGQGSPQQVVSAWLASPGHCANIMNPAFSEMGAAYATNPDSDATIYWTQVLGKR